MTTIIKTILALRNSRMIAKLLVWIIVVGLVGPAVGAPSGPSAAGLAKTCPTPTPADSNTLDFMEEDEVRNEMIRDDDDGFGEEDNNDDDDNLAGADPSQGTDNLAEGGNDGNSCDDRSRSQPGSPDLQILGDDGVDDLSSDERKDGNDDGDNGMDKDEQETQPQPQPQLAEREASVGSTASDKTRAAINKARVRTGAQQRPHTVIRTTKTRKPTTTNDATTNHNRNRNRNRNHRERSASDYTPPPTSNDPLELIPIGAWTIPHIQGSGLVCSGYNTLPPEYKKGVMHMRTKDPPRCAWDAHEAVTWRLYVLLHEIVATWCARNNFVYEPRRVGDINTIRSSYNARKKWYKAWTELMRGNITPLVEKLAIDAVDKKWLRPTEASVTPTPSPKTPKQQSTKRIPKIKKPQAKAQSRIHALWTDWQPMRKGFKKLVKFAQGVDMPVWSRTRVLRMRLEAQDGRDYMALDSYEEALRQVRFGEEYISVDGIRCSPEETRLITGILVRGGVVRAANAIGAECFAKSLILTDIRNQREIEARAEELEKEVNEKNKDLARLEEENRKLRQARNQATTPTPTNHHNSRSRNRNHDRNHNNRNTHGTHRPTTHAPTSGRKRRRDGSSEDHEPRRKRRRLEESEDEEDYISTTTSVRPHHGIVTKELVGAGADENNVCLSFSPSDRSELAAYERLRHAQTQSSVGWHFHYHPPANQHTIRIIWEASSGVPAYMRNRR